MVERKGGGHTRLKDKVLEDQGEKTGLLWPCYRDGVGKTKQRASEGAAEGLQALPFSPHPRP